VATLFGALIIKRRSHYVFPGKIIWATWFTVAALFASALMSPDFIGSMTGDTGRFTGAISAICLIIVAIFHAGFTLEQFKRLVWLYIGVVVVTQIIGILHDFNVFDLPGEHGMVSTFGNLDFFAAYLGTTFPLFVYLLLYSSRNRRILIGFIALSSIYCLSRAGALQGYVDLGVMAILIGLFFIIKFLPERFKDFISELTLNAKTFACTLIVIIWAEAIFLMPFIGRNIPVLGNDEQVQIRGEFWLAGISQFGSSPLFGVGPDQYGNYYETFRTLDSAQNLQSVLANDAHSAPVQTVATLGFVGTIALMLLLAFLVRSIIIAAEKYPTKRNEIAAIALFLFVYFTNAAVSPITLPNKYLFWAAAGFIVGLAYRSEGAPKKSLQAFIGVTVAATLFISGNFAFAQLRYLNWIEEFASNNASKIISVQYSRYIPCAMYYDSLAKIINNQGNEALEKFSRAQLAGNERCVNAQINMAKFSYNKGDIAGMRQYVYALTEMAPSREEVLVVARAYATKADDRALLKKVVSQSAKLGIIAIPVAPAK
ncbi:O-antigen ligase family protein, partial [Haliscomenobacter sp.]|uniref:O-antigen ligase family protein n=1 Tax=Haliscomenobacter sp. TaxID=2717303 RepID=UPI003364D52A